MTPKVLIPEVTNVNRDNERDFELLYEDSEQECEYL